MSDVLYQKFSISFLFNPVEKTYAFLSHQDHDLYQSITGQAVLHQRFENRISELTGRVNALNSEYLILEADRNKWKGWFNFLRVMVFIQASLLFFLPYVLHR